MKEGSCGNSSRGLILLHAIYKHKNQYVSTADSWRGSVSQNLAKLTLDWILKLSGYTGSPTEKTIIVNNFHAHEVRFQSLMSADLKARGELE